MPNPSGRMKTIEASAMRQPCKCSACGRGGLDRNGVTDNRELFADPAIFFEFDGSVYFCRDCVLEMAALFGAAVTVQLRIDLINRNKELIETREALERAERLNDDLTRERLNWRSGVPVSVNDFLSHETSNVINIEQPTDGNDSGSDVEESESLDDSQSGTQEPVNVEGSDDVSEFTGNHIIIDGTDILASIGL